MRYVKAVSTSIEIFPFFTVDEKLAQLGPTGTQ